MFQYQIANIKYQNGKPKFKNFWILICVFDFWILIFGFSAAYALDLSRLKIHFLNGDYSSAISEGERLMSEVSFVKGVDELYYLLGMSYLEDGNYLRASDIFEIILKEFAESRFQEEALLSLGDSYFLKSDFEQAQFYYKKLLKAYPQTKFKAGVYYRLSQIGFKKGNSQQAEEYLARLNEEFPLSLELKLNKEFPQQRIYYTVQVGAFSSKANAQDLIRQLKTEGYPAYIEEITVKNSLAYRVRVGKFDRRQAAEELENKLSRKGYPTKIFP